VNRPDQGLPGARPVVRPAVRWARRAILYYGAPSERLDQFAFAQPTKHRAEIIGLELCLKLWYH
jgi:hypothetical protein